MCSKMSSIFLAVIAVFYSAQYFLLINTQSSPYILEIWDEATINNSVDFNENKFNDSTATYQNCSQTFLAFADALTNLTHCTILNAKPIRICTACKEESHISNETYYALTELPDCRKFYLENDRIDVVNWMHKQGSDLWLKSHCQDCYSNAKDAELFFNMSKKLDNCMKKFNETSVEKTSSDMCEVCGELFIKMNNIYKGFIWRIENDGSAGVCMDIVDQMNITRHVWSMHHCHHKFYSDIGYPNIVTAVVVGCIPVFFYMLSKSIANTEDVKLVRPKRKSFASLHSESLQID